MLQVVDILQHGKKESVIPHHQYHGQGFSSHGIVLFFQEYSGPNITMVNSKW